MWVGNRAPRQRLYAVALDPDQTIRRNFPCRRFAAVVVVAEFLVTVGDKQMDASKYYGSVFLKIDDVKAAGGKIRATIASVEEGKFGKPDITFENGMKLGANATNTRRLA
jgi:hypothetical protein